MIIALLLVIIAIMLFGSGPVTSFISWVFGILLMVLSVGLISDRTGLSAGTIMIGVPLIGLGLGAIVFVILLVQDERRRKAIRKANGSK